MNDDGGFRRAARSADDPAIATEFEPAPTDEAIVGASPKEPTPPTQEVEGEKADRRGESPALPRLLVICLIGAGLAYSITFIQGLGGVIAPVFLALNLMVTAHPLHNALARRGVPRGFAAVVTGAVVLAVLAIFFTSIGWAITQLVTTLPEYKGQFDTLLKSVTDRLQTYGVTPDSLLEQIKQISPSNALGVVAPVFSNLSAGATLMTIMIAIVFFMTMDSVTIDHRLDLAQRYHPRLVGGLRSFAQGVRRYWVVSSVFGLISAALDVVALMILGVPLALVWGVLAFLCNYIPNVGFFLSLIPPALLALLALGPGNALAVVVVYLALNFVVQTLIMPRFTGQAVGITATLTFVSLLFWAWVLGVLGALLAVPATLFFKAILVDADPRARWANALIASDPLTFEVDDDEA